MSLPPKKKARVIAFYLPQFHPIRENNDWWGPGFTEWTNVAKARPLFKGHEQPHIPGELSFYDLRLPETREAQASLAAEYGVEGFCYWHYWFAGRRLLERPFEEVLASGKPDFPFCLGWANETWTGVWHGAPGRILIEQTYPGQADDLRHFQYLLKAFKDPRYIRVNNKPLFVVYKPLKLPNAKVRFDYWRTLALEAGLEGLHIVGVNLLDFDSTEELGLDAAIISALGSVSKNKVIDRGTWAYWGIKRKLGLGGPRVLDYAETIKNLTPELSTLPFKAYHCILPNWDNTPRAGNRGLVVKGSTPELFKQHARTAIESCQRGPEEERIVFLKSWNEWAEGNYMEPDRVWGRQYLESLRDVVIEKPTSPS